MTDTTEKPRELVWTPEMVARFWDWQSRYPDVYFAHLFGAGIADRLFPYFAGAKSILDFGCGSGAFMSRLLAGGAKVAGCDVSPKSIAATTARNGAHPNFAGAATAEALIARGAKFDAIVATETIEHVYDDQLDGILDMMKRLAAPGAKLAFTTPNRENLEDSMVYCPASNVVFHRWQHVRSWSTESLGEYMRARGFRVVDMVETDLSVGRGRYAVHRVLNLLRGRPPAKPHLLGVFQTQP